MRTDAALTLLFGIIDRAAAISAIIANAKADGREELTDEELHAIVTADDEARDALAANIKAHGG